MPTPFDHIPGLVHRTRKQDVHSLGNRLKMVVLEGRNMRWSEEQTHFLLGKPKVIQGYDAALVTVEQGAPGRVGSERSNSMRHEEERVIGKENCVRSELPDEVAPQFTVASAI